MGQYYYHISPANAPYSLKSAFTNQYCDHCPGIFGMLHTFFSVNGFYFIIKLMAVYVMKMSVSLGYYKQCMMS